MEPELKDRGMPDGEEGELNYGGSTFYLKKLFLVTVANLKICRTWNSNTHQSTVEPSLATTLRGVATFNNKLSVIGAPRHSTSSLDLVIHEDDITAVLQARKVPYIAPGIATIVVYVTEHGNEMRDSWTLQCSLSSRTFTFLVEAIESGKLTYLFFRLVLNDLYSDTHWIDSDSGSEAKFLKPADLAIDADGRPGNAWGHIESISLEFDKFTMAFEEPKLEDSQLNTSLSVSPPQAQVKGSNSGKVIEELRSKLLGCVMLVIALIVYIAFR